MAILKCKMCGGDLNLSGGEKIVECEFCGTTQTVPDGNDEKKTNLFNRANRLRTDNEFDKAAGIYESIIAEFPDEAEGYWGLVLCNYGIEYVDDAKTGKKIPTCHRTLSYSVMDDDNFIQACENADVVARGIYREEAKVIDKLQKQIIAIAESEEPYDVFICYKETDDITKSRTEDSQLAQDIYTELIKEGYNVFFSRVTLREKAGTEYEPYIYAALKSAKVMLAIGTKYDYYDAVWVKNEWSRYISMMSEDNSKHLIPCYKNLDAYDIPKEFKNLQALDMGEVTFFKNLIDNVERFIPKAKQGEIKVEQVVSSPAGGTTDTLLKRAFMFLEDGDFKSADEYCEKVLDIDPKRAEAYLGKLMSELEVHKQDDLQNCEKPFDDSLNYQKTMRFADENLKNKLTEDIAYMVNRNKMAEFESLYKEAVAAMSDSTDADAFWDASDMFEEIKDYKDSAELAKQCREKAEIAEKDDILKEAESLLDDSHTWQGKDTDIDSYTKMIEKLETIKDYKDVDKKIVACKNKIEEIKKQQKEKRIAEENARIEQERKAEEERILAEQRKEKNRKLIKNVGIIATSVLCIVIAFVIVLNTVIIPNGKYNEAITALENGDYDQAISLFEEIGYRKDSEDIIYDKAKALLNKERYSESYLLFSMINEYEDSAKNIKLILTNLISQNLKRTISGGYRHTVGLKSDGTVVAVGSNAFGQCDVSECESVVAVSARGFHTVGLKFDGTVVAVGNNEDGQCDVDDWKDIVAVSAGIYHTVGLKSDGTVVAVGNNKHGQCNVSEWNDIVAISAGHYHTVGLKSDGTVVAVGDSKNGQCYVSEWNNIVAVSAGGDHTVGLKSDGTVVAVGAKSYNDYGQCDVDDWKDIVAVSAGAFHTVGLKADGTVVATVVAKSYDDNGQCDVDGWNLFE